MVGVRTCVSCKFARKRIPEMTNKVFRCVREPIIDPVTGDFDYDKIPFAAVERQGGYVIDLFQFRYRKRCGPSGRYWEPKEVE